MSDQKPITIPSVNVLREKVVAKTAELRRLRKMLLLAKAATESGPHDAIKSTNMEAIR